MTTTGNPPAGGEAAAATDGDAALDEELAALRAMLARGRALAAAGDRPGLSALADRIRHRQDDGYRRTCGRLTGATGDLDEALEELYDGAFPIHDPADPADVLDTPWTTRARMDALIPLVGELGWPTDGPPPPALESRTSLDPLIGPAVEAGDVRLLGLLLRTPLASCSREGTVWVLDALHAAGALDVDHLDHALAKAPWLDVRDFDAGVVAAAQRNLSLRAERLAAHRAGSALPGPLASPVPATPPEAGTPGTTGLAGPPGTVEPAAALAWVGLLPGLVEEVFWRRTAPVEEGGRGERAALPRWFGARGLRLVKRAVGWGGGEVEVLEGPERLGWAGARARLGAAELGPGELDELVEWLRGRPEEERRRAFRLRLPAGDAAAVLPVLGLGDAVPLFRLVRLGYQIARYDRSAVLAAAARAGDDGTRRLLELCPDEGIAAALGLNADALRKRVKRDAHRAIAAFGLLPLDGGSVLDRYLELRAIAKRGTRYGPQRRLNHATAVGVALDHLAQQAGFADAGRLEWDCEARIASDSPGSWELGGCAVTLRLDGADPVVAVTRAGRPLRSVPPAVRKDPGYAEVREHQKRLRDQATRMRTGLVERLVGTGGSLRPEELARLCTLPSGAAMLPALIWQDRAGTIGLLDDVDTGGPVTAVHPFTLYERGVLGEWQAEVVRRRLRQPVKQAFRELYVLTPAERAAGDRSARFAGQVVDGKVASSLLAARGWSIHSADVEAELTRSAGGLTASVRCTVQHWFGGGDVGIGEVRFLSGGAAGDAPVPLAEVPAVALSEVMRDLDLVVSVAGTDPTGWVSSTRAESRASLLATLIEDLGLARVRVDGTAAVVRGSRATYRVHLTSGSIHVEPGGYLCVVPATFGGTAHKRLFLPFADDDRMTSVVLSKVLLLAEDEKITDPTILAQLERLAPTAAR